MFFIGRYASTTPGMIAPSSIIGQKNICQCKSLLPKIYSPKVLFALFTRLRLMEIFFTVVKNKFIAVHIPDVFKIYYDSSVAHKEIIPVIKQHYKFGKCTAHRLFGFVRTMNMYAVLKMLGIQNVAKLYTQRVTCRGYFNVFFLQRRFSAKSHRATYQALHRCTA